MKRVIDKHSLVVCEIGAKGHLSRGDARLAARDWLAVAILKPDIPIGFSIGGYDDDPRELLDIPEVTDFLKIWAGFWKDHYLLPSIRSRLLTECQGLLMYALGEVQREQIVYVKR
jgi:hypothetical protein